MSKSKKVVVGDCFKMRSNSLHFNAEAHIMVAIDEMYYGEERYIQSLSGMYKTVCYTEAERLPTLHLPIKGEWFEMIRSGVKKHEYRDLTDFYQKRFKIEYLQTTMGKDYFSHVDRFPFKVLHLTHGYDPNGKRGLPYPQLWVHINEITIGRGNPEWGAPTDRDVFIIHLGDVFHTKNCLK